MSLLNGAKVVVAVAGDIISKTRTSVLAYGGDSGKLQVAIFSHTTRHSHSHSQQQQQQQRPSQHASFHLEESQEKDEEFSGSLTAKAIHSSLTSFLGNFDRRCGTVSTIHDIFEHDICGNLNTVSVGKVFFFRKFKCFFSNLKLIFLSCVTLNV